MIRIECKSILISIYHIVKMLLEILYYLLPNFVVIVNDERQIIYGRLCWFTFIKIYMAKKHQAASQQGVITIWIMVISDYGQLLNSTFYSERFP